MEEWITSLRAAEKTLKEKTGFSNATLTYVFHDWAVIPGTILVNRSLKEQNDNAAGSIQSNQQLVLLDILPDSAHREEPNRPKAPEKVSVKENAKKILYMILMAIAFWVNRYISKYLALIIAGVGMLFLKLLGVAPIGSAFDTSYGEETFKGDRMWRSVYMMYAYYQTLKALASGNVKEVFGGYHLPRLNQVPVLFLYGKDKDFRFHDEKLVTFMKEYGESTSTKTNAIGIENAGHWLYLEQEDACYHALQKFVIAKK